MKYNIGETVRYPILVEGKITGVQINKDGDANYSIKGRTFPEADLVPVKANEPPKDEQDMFRYKEGDRVRSIAEAYEGEIGTVIPPSGKNILKAFDNIEPYTEYKAGDRVRVIGNKANHRYDIGDIAVLKEYTGYYWRTQKGGFYDVYESDIEPYTDDSPVSTRERLVKLGACSPAMAFFDSKHPDGKATYQQLIDDANAAGRPSYAEWARERKDKLCEPDKGAGESYYCYRGGTPGEWLTRGKTYTVDSDGRMKYDDGYTSVWRGLDDYLGMEPFSHYLVREVSRPAKVGETIKVIEDNGRGYKRGEIFRVGYKGDGDCVFREHDGKGNLSPNQYVVLENYKPEEPKYYSGKVVCVDDGGWTEYWTVNKVYEFIGGKTHYDTGEITPFAGNETSIEKLNDGFCAKFIPLKEYANGQA